MKIEWTKSMTKKALIYIFAGTGILLAYFILKNFDELKVILHSGKDILRPFTFGLIFAYLLNGPLMYFEKHLGFIEKTKPRRVLKRVLAMVATQVAAIARTLLRTLLGFVFSINPRCFSKYIKGPFKR